MALTQISDYKGKYEIVTSPYTQGDLLLYIEEFEKTYLRKILGCELAKLYLESDPLEARFEAITNELCFEGACRKEYYSPGLKEVLRGFVYFEYVKEQKNRSTTTGKVENLHENSTVLPPSDTNIIEVFNQSVKWSWAIQFYICENIETYEEFNGRQLGIKFPNLSI